MTSVLMIFETTRDYAVIVPLMISNLVSLFISSRLQHKLSTTLSHCRTAFTCRGLRRARTMASDRWRK